MTVGGATRVACVLGDPVEHSRSPRMHNAAAAALGLDRVYVALRVAPADLAHAVRGLAALGFDGANVTIPHKAAAAALCDELGAEARDAGAVNTLSFTAAGGLRGDLTDGLGLPDRGLTEVPERAVVVGAGGSARGRAAFLRAGTRGITIVARRTEAADGLRDALTALVPVRDGRRRPPCAAGAAVCSSTARPSAASPTSRASWTLPMWIERMDVTADFAYRADGSPISASALAALAAGVPLARRPRAAQRRGALSFKLWTGPRAAARRSCCAAARGE